MNDEGEPCADMHIVRTDLDRPRIKQNKTIPRLKRDATVKEEKNGSVHGSPKSPRGNLEQEKTNGSTLVVNGDQKSDKCSEENSASAIPPKLDSMDPEKAKACANMFVNKNDPHSPIDRNGSVDKTQSKISSQDPEQEIADGKN